MCVLLLGGSCTSDTAAPGHSFDCYERNGVQIAHSSAVPKYEGELFTYEQWYVLHEDEREESLLIRPEPGTLDERGFLYVPDSSPSDWPSVSRIAVFDTTGTFQFAFGQPGQGPGDMWHPQINGIQDGVMETYDLVGQQRLTRYNADGGLLDVETLPPPPATFRTAHCYRMPDGRFLRVVSRTALGEGPRSRMYRAVMYSTRWDSLWALDGEEPVLDVYSLDGRHRLQIRVDLLPEPVTADDQAAFEAPIKEELKTATGIGYEYQKAMLEHLVYPEYKAYWGETTGGTIEIDDSGFIWARIPAFIGSREEMDEVIRYRIFSPEGQYLGITQIPERSRRGMTKLTHGCLVVVEKDPETDAKTVVVYRIKAVN